METGMTANAEVTINVPAAKVWDGLTNPALIKQYFFGTEAISDWKEGSTLIFKGKWEGKEYKDKGVILKAEPGKLLQYKYWSSMSGTEDKPENYNDITYELDEKDGATRLAIIQEGSKTEEAKKHSEQNWAMVLKGLKDLLEKK